MHLGSLFTALASFLQARSNNGTWTLRIDDLDHYRTVEYAEESIIRTLEKHHLFWDGDILYQSEKLEAYRTALDKLESQGLVYACRCSRKALNRGGRPNQITNRYPGYCRNKNLSRNQPHSLRVRTSDKEISFCDELQGTLKQSLLQEFGDFIVLRRDKLFAYQLAVVIDDHEQAINDVFRGIDLLASTPIQIYLQEALSIPCPRYTHIPVLTDGSGVKLSKQTGAPAVSESNPAATLFDLLVLLNQSPPKDLHRTGIDEILDWAIENWNLSKLKHQLNIRIPLCAK